MDRFKRFAEEARRAIEDEGAREAQEAGKKTESPAELSKKPISGADAFARWQEKNEDGPKESRVDELRRKHSKQP